ncbi:MAG: ATP-binding cassette domain-containing protein [Rhodospirillales bacterium]|nr:ATP-binding cassette domain-containing protein [Rhodospirillales bacterium]
MGNVLPMRLDSVCFDAGGRRLINSINGELRQGTRTVVLGPNGAGKSLTLRLCHGLLAPTAGSIRWLGANGTDVRLLQAMVFQRPVMLRRSAAGNIAYALGVRGISGREKARRIDKALDQTGLAEFAAQPARTLSVGEQQRLALARAWALSPQVLFLDEPTASLDPAATRAVEAIINAIYRDGAKIIMTTHDLAQARRLADDVVFLHRGRLMEHGLADDFFAQPQTPEAAAFITGSLCW